MKINRLLAGSLAFVLFVGMVSPVFAQNSAIGDGTASGPLGTSEIIASSPANLNCNLVTFEGIGNNNPVGTIGDATFVGSSAFTDSDDGGFADMANEPSPITVMAGPSTQVVTFSNPQSQVSFWYTIAASDIIVSIFGAGDILLDSFNAPVLPQGVIGGDPTGQFDNWNQAFHNEGSDVITKIEINIVTPSGWLYDDIEFCTGQDFVGGESIPIESSSLILAGAQSFSWMIPVVMSVVGIGIFVVSRKN